MIILGSTSGQPSTSATDPSLSGVPKMIPKETITHVGGDTYRIDSRASELDNGDGTVSSMGASEGNHYYTLTGQIQKLDLSKGPTSALTMVAGSNVSPVGSGHAKNITGNGWNASSASAESYNPVEKDFAFVWSFEQLEAGMNEMMGFAKAQFSGASYTRLAHAIYQVSNYVHRNTYESGKAIVMSGTTHYPSVGDKGGIRTEQGVVTYFVIDSSGSVKDLRQSDVKAVDPMFFATALYRGTDQAAGPSLVGGAELYAETSPSMVTVQIGGQASSEISDRDAIELEKLGMYVNQGATYSDIHFERPVTSRFPSGLSDIDLAHVYAVNMQQGMATIAVN